jgi:hypothetical protein
MKTMLLLMAVLVASCSQPQSKKEETKGELQIVSIQPEVTETGLYKVHFTIKNNSNKLLQTATIKALFYDASKKLVGTAPGVVLNLPAGESKVVDCLGMSITGATEVNAQIDSFLFE